MSLMRKLASWLAATIIGLSTNAQAIPIVYEFRGIVAEGSLNGVAFSDRAFTVNLFGDTSGVVNGGVGTLINPVTAVTFSIAGIGSGTLLDAYRMFLTSDAVGFSYLSDASDRIDVLNAGALLGGYALASAFGPINSGFSFVGQFLPDATSAGDLDMFGGSDVIFRSFLRDAPVPEPASYLLLVLGLAALVRGRRGRT